MEQLKTCPLKRTVLYEKHALLGAKLVEFAGWQMPVQYTSLIQEHLAVRQHVGIFDVSHMGRILVQGPEAERFLDYLCTNKIADKSNFSATYTVLCREDGYCVDDVIVYKQDPHHFFVIANAGNRQKDLDHLKKEAQAFTVEIQDRYDTEGILAIQGPSAHPLLLQLFPEALNLKPMHFMMASYRDQPIILSGTGYTGAGGFEIYAPNGLIPQLWDLFLTEGKSYQIQPIGLGARDTLRLEMGYALYGHEISESIAPIESVSAWTVKWDKKDFLGKEALQKLQQKETKRSEYGIVLSDKGIAREGYEVFREDKKIGTVTSGTMSPSLQKAIAIVLVEERLQEGDYVEVQIRQQRVKAQVVKLPFWKLR